MILLRRKPSELEPDLRPVPTPHWADSRALSGCQTLLLLFFLLHQDLGLQILERLKDVGVEEGVADVDQLDLQRIDGLMQPQQLEDLVDSSELKLGNESTSQLFRVIAETTVCDPGNPSERSVQPLDAEFDRPGEIIRQHEKFSHQPRVHLGSMDGFVSIPGTARMEHRRPSQSVHLAHCRRDSALWQKAVAHVQDAGSHVGPFEEFTRLQKQPSFIVRDGGVGQALEGQRAGFDLMQEIKRTGFPIFPGLWECR